MAEIRLERVTKLFKQVQAVDAVDLTIADGEFMVLLGPSGCGKTTLLRTIAGLETIDSGRISVARAIAMQSQVLLMDEPLSNLDALLRIEMRAELKRLLKEIGSTTIYVTHDQVEALSMGDRIAVMRSGKLVQVGDPLTIYDQPVDRFVGSFIGNPPMNFLDVMVERRNGHAVALVDGAGEVTVDEALARHAGRQLLLGIRAENVEVTTS